tara:strand:- start:4925 stop:5155 length:231 start_codon:yes stop_codon:yes gene_type:complete
MAQIKVIGKSLDSPTWTKFRLRAREYQITGPWMEPESPGPFTFVDISDSTVFVDIVDQVSFTETTDQVVIYDNQKG